MKTYDTLKKELISIARNPNHINPALEGLCGIIDRQNRRIEAIEKILNKNVDE